MRACAGAWLCLIVWSDGNEEICVFRAAVIVSVPLADDRRFAVRQGESELLDSMTKAI